FGDSVGYIRNALRRSGAKFDRIIFITAYKAYRDLLLKEGYKAVYIPMAIDVETVRQFQSPRAGHDRFLWFGNVYGVKRPLFNHVRQYCKAIRIGLDYLSYRKLNSVEPVKNGPDTFKLISQYKYGIGVGRCALEMWALGMRVIVAGRQL